MPGIGPLGKNIDMEKIGAVQPRKFKGERKVIFVMCFNDQ